MEIKKFTLDELLNINVQSNEIKNWLELLDLYGMSRTTLKTLEESTLERFIKTYPPENNTIAYYDTVHIIIFGLLFFNKDKILEKNVSIDKIGQLLSQQKNFYDEILSQHFKESFKIAMDEDNPVDYYIAYIVKILKEKNNSLWLRIKKDFESTKMAEELDGTLNTNKTKMKKSLKV